MSSGYLAWSCLSDSEIIGNRKLSMSTIGTPESRIVIQPFPVEEGTWNYLKDAESVSLATRRFMIIKHSSGAWFPDGNPRSPIEVTDSKIWIPFDIFDI